MDERGEESGGESRGRREEKEDRQMLPETEGLLEMAFEEGLKTDALLVLADALGDEEPVLAEMVGAGARLFLPPDTGMVQELVRVVKAEGQRGLSRFRTEMMTRLRATVRRCWEELEYGDLLVPCHMTVKAGPGRDEVHLSGGCLKFHGLRRVEWSEEAGFRTWPEMVEVPERVRLMVLATWIARKASHQNLYDAWARPGKLKDVSLPFAGGS